MRSLSTAITDIQDLIMHGGSLNSYKAQEALSIITALRLGATTFTTHVQRFQDRWERGDYTETEHIHVAQLTHAFVKFIQGLENPDSAEQDPMLWLGALALGGYMPSEVFLAPENADDQAQLTELARAIDIKYGPVEEYRWCKHGFLHAIDCEEGCTKADCRTEWPQVNDEDVR